MDTIPIEQLVMPHLNPSDIIGQKFVTKLKGDPFQAEVIKHQGQDKFLVKFGDGDDKKILTYNYIIDLINNRLDSGEDGYMSSEDIIDHRIHPKTRKYEVLVKWNLSDPTWEPLTLIAKTDPITCAKYGRDHNLLNKPQWKWFKPFRSKIKHVETLWRNIHNTSHKNTRKYKFGVAIPWN